MIKKGKVSIVYHFLINNVKSIYQYMILEYLKYLIRIKIDNKNQ